MFKLHALTALIFLKLSLLFPASAEDNVSVIQDFTTEFSAEYQPMLKGLPWIPDSQILRDSFATFIKKIKKDPDAKGLSIGSLTQAFKFFEENRDDIVDKGPLRKLLAKGSAIYSPNKSGISNQDYIVIANYTLSRYTNRLFFLNLKKNQILSTTVAHGYGSNRKGGKYQKVPNYFSNEKDEGTTSRGFYLTATKYCSKENAKKYFGKCRGTDHTNAMWLDGFSENNWKARIRGIVFHGATYVCNSEGASGNSAGCISLPESFFDRYADRIKEGALLYVYTNHEFKAYLNSKTW